MVESESIMSIALLGIISVIVIFIISSVVFSDLRTSNKTIFNMHKHNQDTAKIETFLLSTNMYSEISNSETIAVAALNDGSYATIYGETDLKRSIKDNMDFIMGEKNYYANFNAKINNLNINLLYDDGEYMSGLNERFNFPQIINNLQSEFEKDGLKVDFKIYILSRTDDSTECNKYKHIDCETISIENDLYSDEIMEIDGTLYSMEDMIKKEKNYNATIDYQNNFYALNDWASFLSRVSVMNTDPTRMKSVSKKDLYILFTDVMNYGGAPKNFFTLSDLELYEEPSYDSCMQEADICGEGLYNSFIGNPSSPGVCSQWCIDNAPSSSEIGKCIESSVSTMLTSYPVDISGFNDTMVDRFDGSSDNMEMPSQYSMSCSSYFYSKYLFYNCQHLYDSCAENLMADAREISFGHYYYQFYCPLNNNSDYEFSNEGVDRAVAILKNNGHNVYPIVVHEYGLSDSPRESLLMKKFADSDKSSELGIGNFPITNDNGNNQITMCGKEGCPGCYEDATGAIFHKETQDMHLEQTKIIAEETDGKHIDISENMNIYNTLYNVIDEIINGNKIEIGNPLIIPDKNVYMRDYIVEINGESILFEAYIESNPKAEYIFNKETFNFKPIISNININTTSSSQIFNITIGHNKEISSVRLIPNTQTGSIRLIDSLGGKMYKYEVIFHTTPSDPSSFIIEYTDSDNKNIIKYGDK